MNKLSGLRILVCFMALVGCALAAHHRSLTYSFIGYDDQLFVLESPRALSGITTAGVVDAFTDVRSDSNWVPMARLSHMLDVQLYGLDARGHHLTNVLFHTANGVILWLLLMQMTGCFWRPFATALLFAVHPVHVESVAWIAERRDVLSLFFGLLCMLAYVYYKRDPSQSWRLSRKWLWYGLTCLLGLLSMMSKPTMVTLPCVLLLLDYWPLKQMEVIEATPRQPWRAKAMTLGWLIVEKLPLFAAAGLAAALTTIAQTEGMVDMEQLPWLLRVVRVPLAYMDYLTMLVWPVGLSPYYADHFTWHVWQVAAGVGVLLAMTYAALRQWRDRQYLLVGWFWFLGSMVPMIGLVQVGQQTSACRYAYFPFIGLYLMLVWLVGQAVVDCGYKRWQRWSAGSALGVLTLLSMTLAYQQTQIWSGNEALFAAANRNHQNQDFLAMTRSRQLILNHQQDQARGILRSAIVHAQQRDTGLIEMLTILEISLNHLDLAQKQATMLIHQKRDTPDTWLLMSEIATLRHQPDSALEYSLKAVQLNPDSALAQMYAGSAYNDLKRYESARKHFEMALNLNPFNDEIQYKVGQFRARQGEYESAIPLLYAVTQKPSTRLAGPAWYALADALLSKGDREQALRAFHHALDKPDVNVSWVWNSIGIIHIQERQYTQARDSFIAALKADPANPQAAENLTKIEKFLRSRETVSP